MLSHCNPSVLDFKYFTWFSRQYNNSHTNDACHLSWNKYVASWFSICQQTPSHFEYFILVNYLQDSTMVPDSCRPDGHWNKSAGWFSKSLQTANHFISVSIYKRAPVRDGHWLTGTVVGHWNKSAGWFSKSLQTASHFLSEQSVECAWTVSWGKWCHLDVNHVVNVLVWTRVMIVTMTKAMMAIMSIVRQLPVIDVVSSKWWQESTW